MKKRSSDARLPWTGSPGCEPIDSHFARLIGRLAKSHQQEAMLAASIASQAVRHGHICVNLAQVTSLDFVQSGAGLLESATVPQAAGWRTALRQSGVTGQPGEFKPLILDSQDRLYLHRYWSWENSLALAILKRVAEQPLPLSPAATTTVERYFPKGESAEPIPQQTAILNALSRRFSVITGGPGTGKTHTITLLAAVLAEISGAEAIPIAVTAPTGRAANRLSEALRTARESLRLPETVANRLPKAACTLHRLLGAVPGASSFRFSRKHPLPYETIVVDESSMVDLVLMAKLFEACRDETRIVLVGDHGQLASVEAGAVLGDICDGLTNGRDVSRFNVPLEACIVQLKTHHRFGAGTGLKELSDTINQGSASVTLAALKSRGPAGAIRFKALPSEESLSAELRPILLAQFGALLKETEPARALALLARFRILCAVRNGSESVEQLNRIAEQALAEAGLIHPLGQNYAGRPIMILRNDHRLQLFNGDVGLLLADSGTGRLRAWFPDAGNGARNFAPARLPEHETAFAMTVHKSQGSEFDSVLLVLPRTDNPVMTREWFYTGVTRARRTLEIWGEDAAIARVMGRTANRTGGLAARLWRDTRD